MRVVVTGGSGFVGSWLIAHLEASGDQVSAPTVDITDAGAVRAAFAELRPDAVYHLAGQADVGASWRTPLDTFAVNATGTLHVLEAARALETPPKVLVTSSAEVYGKAMPADLPLHEESPVRPVSPYGASKVAAEQLALQAHRGSGVPVVVSRAFNHIGPRQSDRFVVSALARQIARAEREGVDEIHVGNLEPRRDFTDVRDVVRAYRLLVVHGTPGEIYNVCSGADVPIADVVDRLCALAGRPVRPTVVPERLRPVDVPALRGDAAKLRAHTGWVPERSLDESLADVLGWWRQQRA